MPAIQIDCSVVHSNCSTWNILYSKKDGSHGRLFILPHTILRCGFCSILFHLFHTCTLRLRKHILFHCCSNRIPCLPSVKLQLVRMAVLLQHLSLLQHVVYRHNFLRMTYSYFLLIMFQLSDGACVFRSEYFATSVKDTAIRTRPEKMFYVEHFTGVRDIYQERSTIENAYSLESGLLEKNAPHQTFPAHHFSPARGQCAP